MLLPTITAITPPFNYTYSPLPLLHSNSKRRNIIGKLSFERSKPRVKPKTSSSKMGKYSLSPLLVRFKQKSSKHNTTNNNNGPDSALSTTPTQQNRSSSNIHSSSSSPRFSLQTQAQTTTMTTTTTSTITTTMQTTTQFYLASAFSSTETLVDAPSPNLYTNASSAASDQQFGSALSSSTSSSSVATTSSQSAITQRQQRRRGRAPDFVTMGIRGAMAGAAGVIMF